MALSCLSVMGKSQGNLIATIPKVTPRNPFLGITFETNPPTELFGGSLAFTVANSSCIVTENSKIGTGSLKGNGGTGSYIYSTKNDFAFWTNIGASYCFWIYLLGSTASTAYVFYCGMAPALNYFTVSTSLNLKFCGQGNGVNLQLNTWYHIAAVVNGPGSSPANTCYVYLDGVLQESFTGTNVWQASPMRFYYGNGPGGTPSLNGYMDDVRSYNANLTQAEITAIFTGNITI